MPISDAQSPVLKCIATHRSLESYLVGATVLHREETTPRYSQGLDLFHDLQESIARSAASDAESLQEAGYAFEWLLRTPSFYLAVATSEGRSVKLEWAQDRAFRFFPLQEDAQCGYRPHDADAAVNKMLALAGRSEIRDFVDVLHLNETSLSLGALAWAACGKDPGFTPNFLLGQAGRHVPYTQADLDRLDLRTPLDLRIMKQQWIDAVEGARRLVALLPGDELGCLYIDSDQKPDPNSATTAIKYTKFSVSTITSSFPSVVLRDEVHDVFAVVR